MPPQKKSNVAGLGIPCEHCRSLDTEVVKTQPLVLFVRRQRRCRKCRKRTETIEMGDRWVRSFLGYLCPEVLILSDSGASVMGCVGHIQGTSNECESQ